MSQWRSTAAAMAIALSVGWCHAAALAADIHVMCPPPLRTTLTELTPLFERASGHRLLVSFEPSKAIIDHVTGGAGARPHHPHRAQYR